MLKFIPAQDSTIKPVEVLLVDSMGPWFHLIISEFRSSIKMALKEIRWQTAEVESWADVYVTRSLKLSTTLAAIIQQVVGQQYYINVQLKSL